MTLSFWKEQEFVYILFDRKPVKDNMMTRVFILCVFVVQIIILLIIKGIHADKVTFEFWNYFGRHRIFMCYLAAVNLVTFGAFAIDKANAIKHKSRIKIVTLLGCYPFFIYQLVQFIRGIPKDLDEEAYIDGCKTFKTFTRILVPLLKPALFSAGLLQFIWTYNDYFNTLIYVNSTSKFPVSLALRHTLDGKSVVEWCKVMAMSCMVVLPLIILFFAAQKYFVEDITAGGIKG